MKILFILEKRSKSGFEGVSKHLIYCCKELNKRKIDYLVLYNAKDKMYNYMLKHNIKITYLPFPAKSPKYILHKRFEISKFRKLIKKIVDTNSITHIHVLNAYILDFLEKKWNIKITAHHFNAFIKNEPIKYFYLKLLLNPRLLLRRFYEKLIVFNYKKADKVIAVSKAAKKTLIEKYVVQREKIKIIYNGVGDIRKNKNPNLRNKFGIKKSDKVILSVGRITKAKGVEDFCEVAKKFKDGSNIKFIFIGAYNDQNYYKYIKNKYKNFVIFPGETVDVSSFYKISDIFLFLSHRDSFGLVLVEAMYYKLPAIVWNVTGLSEVVTNNYNGYCCPFGKLDTVYKKLNYLISNKIEYRRISTNAFNKKDMFTMSKHVDKFLNFILSLKRQYRLKL